MYSILYDGMDKYDFWEFKRLYEFANDNTKKKGLLTDSDKDKSDNIMTNKSSDIIEFHSNKKKVVKATKANSDNKVKLGSLLVQKI